jgi:hypothetical protein
MRRALAALVLALTVGVATASAGDLTLRDVYELHRTGMGDDLLIALVEADPGPLELSLADIQDLKGAGFSERLIAALVMASRRPTAQPPTAPVVVQQHVYAPTYAPTFAPTFVYAPTVVIAPRPREDDSPRRPPVRREKPPATWVTPKAK